MMPDEAFACIVGRICNAKREERDMLSVRTYLGAAAVAVAVVTVVTGFADAQEKQQDRHQDRRQDRQMERLQWVPEMRAAINACIADHERLCGDVMPGNGRIVRCLASQGDRLSVACANAMQRASDALIAAGVAINPGLIAQ
jgi:7-keto-8-aminopelargonate synthetase-like enzyme